MADQRRNDDGCDHGPGGHQQPSLEALVSQLPPAILLRGIVFWSRMHGLISLELDHHLASMQLDPELPTEPSSPSSAARPDPWVGRWRKS